MKARQRTAPYRKQNTPISKQFMLDRCVVNPDTGCWEWQFGKNRDGYGLVREPGGKMERANRKAWILWRGEIPPGLSVLHECDVPACFNPEHLFLGTQDDNMKDCAKKGRIVAHSGLQNGFSKLSRDEVLMLRAMPGTVRGIARKTGFSREIVNGIKNKNTYPDVQ